MIQCDLLLVILFLPAVHLIGVEFTCPTFTDGLNIVSCKINRTAVEAAECESVQDYVTLQKTTRSNKTLLINAIESFQVSNCKPVQEPVAVGCWCDESNGEMFTYKCAFKANQTQDIDARLECKICISPKNSLKENIHENCRPMRFGRLESDGGSNVGLIVGVSLIVVVLLVITAVIILKKILSKMGDGNWWPCKQMPHAEKEQRARDES